MSGVASPAQDPRAMFEFDPPVLVETPVEDVVISNGFNRFHLAAAAAEIDRHRRLAAFITGAYPTARLRSALDLTGLSRSRKVARLLARRQPLAEQRVRPLWLAEAMNAAASYGLRHPVSRQFASHVDRLSLKVYARQAVRKTVSTRDTARVYHYRSGFGHRSALAARERGMVLLCDHSIAHPAVVEYLVEHDGALPPSDVPLAPSRRLRDLLEDIGHADAVLVNSHFVKATFLAQGWDASKIHVIYLGVEDGFLGAIQSHRDRRPPEDGPLRLLFAGAIGKRKGAHPLLAALASLEDVDWQLDLVGSVERDVTDAHAALLRDPRVRYLGTRSHSDVARLMADAEIFVFPTLAEGSARVVFEALAAGCYVVTTPNAGSIVEDGVHGALVPPGDVEAIATALRRAADDRRHVGEVGRTNELLVRSRYRQEDYGAALVALYDSLLVDHHRSAA